MKTQTPPRQRPIMPSKLDLTLRSEVGPVGTVRSLRADNIARVLISHWKEWELEGFKNIGVNRLRDIIRAEANMPPIVGQNDSHTKDLIEGDYKAHGDATGGHALHLERIKVGQSKAIPLTEENYRICLEWLDARCSPPAPKKPDGPRVVHSHQGKTLL